MLVSTKDSVTVEPSDWSPAGGLRRLSLPLSSLGMGSCISFNRWESCLVNTGEQNGRTVRNLITNQTFVLPRIAGEHLRWNLLPQKGWHNFLCTSETLFSQDKQYWWHHFEACYLKCVRVKIRKEMPQNWCLYTAWSHTTREENETHFKRQATLCSFAVLFRTQIYTAPASIPGKEQ